MKVGEALKLVTGEWRALKNEDKQKLKNLAQVGKLFCIIDFADMNRFAREVKNIQTIIGNKSIKSYLKGDKNA